MAERHLGGRRPDDEPGRGRPTHWDDRSHWADRDDTERNAAWRGASAPTGGRHGRPDDTDHGGWAAGHDGGWYAGTPPTSPAPRHAEGYATEYPPVPHRDDDPYGRPSYPGTQWVADSSRADGRYDDGYGTGYESAPRYGAGYDGAGYDDSGYADPRYADPRYADRAAYNDRGYRPDPYAGRYDDGYGGHPDDRRGGAAVAYAGHDVGIGDDGIGDDRFGDADAPSDYLDTPVDDPDDRSGRWSRRKVVGTLVGTGLAAAACSKVATSDKVRQAVSPFVNDLAGPETPAPAAAPPSNSLDTSTGGMSKRGAGGQPSKARTYSGQNDSYMGSEAGAQLKRNTAAVGQVYSGPAAAAAATKVTLATVLAKDPIRHLASRTTFGPTPAVVAEIRRVGIDKWLSQQLQPQTIPLTQGEQMLQGFETYGKSVKQLRDMRESAEKSKRDRAYADEESILITMGRQMWSNRQLLEVMVDFWSDFLHVASTFDGGEMVRSDFENNVIRKHALGNYVEMFVAANHHPALLRYLNQDESTKQNLNENLARENLELYTVGVDGGYTEVDVRQAAMLQSGLRIRDDEFYYDADAHYVGPVKILGFSNANASAAGGLAVIDAYLRYIALHPSTARYIGRELATHFVSDVPPKSLVDRLAAAYTKNKGNIVPVLVTLFSSSEFWAAVGQKVRRPMEALYATYRTLGVRPGSQQELKEGLKGLYYKLQELGQYPGGMPTPNGYPNVFVAWTSAGNMINLWNEALGAIYGGRKQFMYTKPESLVAAPPATAGAYVDALSRRLVNQTLLPKDRAAVLAVAGVPATATVNASFNGAIGAVARAILASPQHSLK
jgi:uncharacterized protein (DUF1800 family)